MNMIGNPGACRLSLVDAHVESVRMHDLAQRRHGELGCGKKLGAGSRLDLGKAAGVLIGHDHQVTRVVRVEIEHHEDSFTPKENMILLVLVLMSGLAKDTARLL